MVLTVIRCAAGELLLSCGELRQVVESACRAAGTECAKFLQDNGFSAQRTAAVLSAAKAPICGKLLYFLRESSQNLLWI
jgi:hypothetical protein